MWEEDKPATSKKKAASKKKSAAKKESNEEVIPTTEDPSMKMQYVDLPSNGLLGYPQTVQYRDLFMADEKVLGSAQDDNYFRTLNTVLKSVLGNPDFFDDMSTFDRDYLLVWIWANNYDSKKSMVVTCPECNKKETTTVDLTKLAVHDIDERLARIHPMRIPLKCGTDIWVRLRTIRDEIDFEEYLKKNGEDANVGGVISAFYTSSIEIDGLENPSLEEKMEWAENNIRAKEVASIRYFHETFSFGVDEQFTHKCSGCGEESVHTIPFRIEDFLQPTVSGDFEDLLQLNENNGDQSG